MATNISTLNVQASPSKVWDALINPEKVKLWQYGSVLTTDWQEGGAIRFTTVWKGQRFEQWGTVLAFLPNQSLKYSLFAPRPDLEDRPEHYFEMEYTLTKKGRGTLLRIIQEDNRPGAKQEAEQGEENPVLKMLKELVEQ